MTGTRISDWRREILEALAERADDSYRIQDLGDLRPAGGRGGRAGGEGPRSGGRPDDLGSVFQPLAPPVCPFHLYGPQPPGQRPSRGNFPDPRSGPRRSGEHDPQGRRLGAARGVKKSTGGYVQVPEGSPRALSSPHLAGGYQEVASAASRATPPSPFLRPGRRRERPFSASSSFRNPWRSPRSMRFRASVVSRRLTENPHSRSRSTSPRAAGGGFKGLTGRRK